MVAWNSCQFEGLRSPLWIYVSVMECETADYEPGHDAIRPKWCALGTLTKHNGELSWTRDKKWHNKSVSVGFCGQDVFANIMWYADVSQEWRYWSEMKNWRILFFPYSLYVAEC